MLHYFTWQMVATSYFNFIGWKFDVNSSIKNYSQKNLTTKLRKSFLVCSYNAAFLPNVFRAFGKLWAVFNAEKKLFNPVKFALTKIPRSEAKIYQKMDFLSSEGHLLPSSGCCLTLASLLDGVQVRFASGSIYRVLLVNDLFNLLVVSVLSQKYNACTFCLQK